MTSRAPTISVVVPAYDSARSLPELISRLTPVLASLSSKFEILLVNDGSRDDTWQTISELAKRHAAVVGINLMRNYGQHNALLAGIRLARYELVVTLDDDLQNPPEEIPRLLAHLESGFDVVYGYPEHEHHGLWRDIASQITKIALASTMGVSTARHVSAFRVFRTRLREAFRDYRSPRVSLDSLLTWGTGNFGAIPVRHDPRRIGVTNYTFRKLVIHAINMITGFTILPLQITSLIGFLFAFGGMVVLGYVLGRYFTLGRVVPGFAFLASVIAIFSGAQLFALGIIGEYLARMHLRLMERPPYTVAETTRHEPGTTESV
jgi:glycosyltransferase involved in cell wall biosynthesis